MLELIISGLLLTWTPGPDDPMCEPGQIVEIDFCAQGSVPGETPSNPGIPAEETKTLRWFLPDGGDANNVTWPQAIYTNQCDGWIQVDEYPYTTEEEKIRTDALDDDGVLSSGEDSGWVLNWWFEKAPECRPVVILPVDPPVTVPPVTPPVTVPPVTVPPVTPNPAPPVVEPALPVVTPSPTNEAQPVVTRIEPPKKDDVVRTELAETGISKMGVIVLSAIGITTLGLTLVGIARRPKRSL